MMDMPPNKQSFEHLDSNNTNENINDKKKKYIEKNDG